MSGKVGGEPMEAAKGGQLVKDYEKSYNIHAVGRKKTKTPRPP